MIDYTPKSVMDRDMGPVEGLLCPNCGQDYKTHCDRGMDGCPKAHQPVTAQYIRGNYGALSLNPNWQENRYSGPQIVRGRN